MFQLLKYFSSDFTLNVHEKKKQVDDNDIYEIPLDSSYRKKSAISEEEPNIFEVFLV